MRIATTESVSLFHADEKLDCVSGNGIGDLRFKALVPQRMCQSFSNQGNQGVRKTFPVNGSFTSVPGGNW